MTIVVPEGVNISQIDYSLNAYGNLSQPITVQIGKKEKAPTIQDANTKEAKVETSEVEKPKAKHEVKKMIYDISNAEIEKFLCQYSKMSFNTDPIGGMPQQLRTKTLNAQNMIIDEYTTKMEMDCEVFEFYDYYQQDQDQDED